MHTSTGFDLSPIAWHVDDKYRDPAVFRANERFWWHQDIVDELTRLRSLGYEAASVELLASNLRIRSRSPLPITGEVAHSCRQMITWGELRRAQPLTDHHPTEWVARSIDP